MNAAVESMFRTNLVAVPAFMRVEPATISGPASGAMEISTARESSESGVQLMPMVRAPRRRASATRPEHVGRASAGGDPNQHILRAEAALDEVAGADGRIVLGGFGGVGQRGFAAGDDALHHLGRDAEGRLAFGGVQHAQAAAGACADVKEPAALLHGGHDCVHGARDGRDFRAQPPPLLFDLRR